MADRHPSNETAELKQQIYFLTNLINKAKKREKPPAYSQKKSQPPFCFQKHFSTSKAIQSHHSQSGLHFSKSSGPVQNSTILRSVKFTNVPQKLTKLVKENPKKNFAKYSLNLSQKHSNSKVEKSIVSNVKNVQSGPAINQNKEILSQGKYSSVKKEATEPNISDDLRRHSLESLKKILADKIEAKKVKKTKQVTKHDSGLKNDNPKQETASKKKSVINVEKLGLPTQKSSKSACPHSANVNNVNSVSIVLKQDESAFDKVTAKASSTSQVKFCKESEEKIQSTVHILQKSSKPSLIESNMPILQEGKIPNLSSSKKPCSVSSSKAVLCTENKIHTVPNKSDLAENLKSTEAKIRELTVELTKLKEAAEIVSSSPKKTPPRYVKTSVQPVKSSHHYRKQSSSPCSSQHLGAKSKTFKSNTQTAAKFIISKYKLNKLPQKHSQTTSKNYVKFNPKYKISHKPTSTPQPKYSPFSKVSRKLSPSARKWQKSSPASSSPYRYPAIHRGKPTYFSGNSVVRGAYRLPTHKQMRWSSQSRPSSRYNKHVYVKRLTSFHKGRNPSKKGYNIKPKTISVRGVKFQLGASGKTLQRIQHTVNVKKGVHPKRSISRVDYRGVTYVETKPGMLEKLSTTQARWRASQSVQRSIVLARNKPKKAARGLCMFYCRFGKCNRGDKCQYIHDPDKVAVCTRFLRGTCKIEKCQFSHKVSKEKMPVCSYFLSGRCMRDNCPYLHVKVGENAKVCKAFLQGFCPDGEKCKEKHIRVCPEFLRTGQCSAGGKCPLQHKRKGLKRKATLSTAKINPTGETPRPSLVEAEPVEQSNMIPFKSRKLPAFISIVGRDDTVPEMVSGPTLISQEPLRIKPRF